MSKDLSLVYSRLFSMLAWQIATAPLFLILVAQFNSLCADGSSPYSCSPTPPPFLMEYNIFFPWLDFWRHWGYFANSQTIPNWSVPLRIQCFKRCSHEKQMRCWFKTGGLKSEGFFLGWQAALRWFSSSLQSALATESDNQRMARCESHGMLRLHYQLHGVFVYCRPGLVYQKEVSDILFASH